jgi:uracil-DNA glycosylase family 4
MKNNAEKLKNLFDQFTACTRCPLGTQGRTQVVFGAGNPQARVMFIGEGPGKSEDLQGKPFVGRSGKLLTTMIESIGLKREDVWISNIVKCRPPNNRTPLPYESSTCSSLLLFKEIEIIKPRIICTLGSCAAQILLKKPKMALATVRGALQIEQGLHILPTYHPAYLLRNPAAKQVVLKDFEIIKKALLDATL